MRFSFFAERVGRRRLKQKRARPTTTSCVVGHLCRFRAGRRQRSALRNRSRSAWIREIPTSPPMVPEGGVERETPTYTKKVRIVCWKVAIGQSASGKAA